MSVDEIFNSMSDRVKADQAAGVNMTLLFDLSGPEGGQWYVSVADGKADVSKTAPAAAPVATVRMSAEDYMAMSSGSLNPMMAFMTGKVKVEGDLNSVMKFQQLVGF
jgi:putative sterol carrier protein